MTDPDEARYLARASNLLATFRQIAQDEHPNVIAEAALAFLAEALANHPKPERDGAARAGPVTDDSGPDRRGSARRVASGLRVSSAIRIALERARCRD